MRTITKALAILAATPLLFAAAAPGVAATGLDYRGVYDGKIIRKACTTTPTEPETMWATGTWSVRITDDKVVASTNLFYDGIHHLAWGGSALPAFGVEQAPTASHPGFVIQSDLGVIGGSDTTLTLRLTDDGDLSYRVAPYHMFGYECASLTLSGHTN